MGNDQSSSNTTDVYRSLGIPKSFELEMCEGVSKDALLILQEEDDASGGVCHMLRDVYVYAKFRPKLWVAITEATANLWKLCVLIMSEAIDALSSGPRMVSHAAANLVKLLLVLKAELKPIVVKSTDSLREFTRVIGALRVWANERLTSAASFVRNRRATMSRQELFDRINHHRVNAQPNRRFVRAFS